MHISVDGLCNADPPVYAGVGRILNSGGHLTSWLLAIGLPIVYALGVYSGIDALMRGRNAQSTTAWILALIFIPFVTIPLYFAFGRRGYDDYVAAQERFDAATQDMQRAMRDNISRNCEVRFVQEPNRRTRAEIKAFDCFGEGSFTGQNSVELLINGGATFQSIFSAIDAAKRYVFIQFYIIHDDEIGSALKDRIIDARKRDVAVCLLYDEVGSINLPDSYLQRLRDAGVSTAAFSGGRRSMQKFRLNFRNHRKIVVVDGGVAFVGGLNVGNEYLGCDETIGFWRDTHLRVAGPSALELQLSFLRDWYFATESIPAGVNVTVDCQDRGANVLIADSGPHDDIGNCGMLYAHVISSAEQRLWVATPYLVPDGSVLAALQLAAMRGVDVRVIVPRSSDSLLFKYVPYAFFEDIVRAGGRIYFYEKGFMHQKVILVDNDYGVVSTANMDNRSFQLNFEVSCVVRDASFCAELEQMLENDLADSTLIGIDQVGDRSYIDRLATQGTRLLAPLL